METLARRRRHQRRDQPPSLLTLLLVITLGALLAGAAPARAQETISAATGHAQVVAHGVVTVPDGDVVWRVVARRAAVPEEITAATGFLLGEQGDLLVVDQPRGDAFLLAPGMALLTRDGVRQDRRSLSQEASRYATIELVPATAAPATGGDQRFISDPFPGSGADHSIALVRDSLADGELSEVAAGMGRTLVMATSGTIDVATVRGETPVQLAAGDAIALGGAVNVSANAGPATFVAAVIGPEVVLPPRQTSQVAAPGSVEVVARLCPAGYAGGAAEGAARFAADCPDALAGVRFTLTGLDGERTAQTDTGGRFRIDNLAPGDYLLTSDIPGDFARFQVFCVNATLGGEATTAQNRFDILMTAGARVQCEWYVVPDTAAGAGAISVQGLLCPSPTAPRDACTYTDAIFGGSILLSGPAGTELTFATGTSHAVSHVWEGLPYGTYYLTSIALADPAGYRLERIDGVSVVEAGVEAIVVDAATPQVSVDFVYIPTEAGTLTLSVYTCPTATSPLAECAPRFVAGEIAIEGPQGIRLDQSNSDVSQRGDRRWEGLPFGAYHLAANLLTVDDPAYSLARVDGAADYFEAVATVVLDAANPDAHLEVVFAPAGPVPVSTGSIQVTGVMCPLDPSLGECWESGDLGDIVLTGPDGTVLTLFNGTSHGASYVWEGLPYGTYTFDPLALTPPGGTVFDHAEGSVTPTQTGYAIVLDAANPAAFVTLVWLGIGSPDDEGVGVPGEIPDEQPVDPIADPAADQDGDGLSDGDEWSIGTDPGNPDTDGDGFWDGEEWVAGTDPFDAASIPAAA